MTIDPNDIGLFKTPTLRNIEFLALICTMADLLL